MPSLLCETVTGDTMDGLLAARDRAAAADMVELRLDGVKDLDLEAALHRRRGPVVVTCRPDWEGGRFTGREEERHRILTRALDLGADHVDIEWRALRRHQPFHQVVRAHGRRVVLSSHDFDGLPPDLCARVQEMRGAGAALIKIAAAAATLSDTLPLLQIARGHDAVVVGMGDAGVATRLLATRFGSRWTYGGDGIAPGQVPAARMLDEFRFRSIGDDTRLYGVVGDDVMDSFEPAMHNAAFAAAGLDAVCVPLRAADFGDFLAFAAAIGFTGASVRAPFTRDALEAAADADDESRRAGAADTLRRGRAGWHATYVGIGDWGSGIGGDQGLEAGADRHPDPSRSPIPDPRSQLALRVSHAERQFVWWTGQRPKPGVMHAVAIAKSGN